MLNATVKVNDSHSVLATVLGQGTTRIATGGKIRAGIKVLTSKAAAHPEACVIYQRGVAAGESFSQIEQALVAALPQIKSPLVPKNVPWFTVRAQDFDNPVIARQILDAHGEDRGDGVQRLYRFPVVFPSDIWQLVMPHELACWGASDKRFWSQYTPDGRVRYCKQYAGVPFDDTGKRVIRIFGGRKAVSRDQNGGLCDPESCAEYQLRQCNLSGRFLFFIPGIRSISAFELHTNSFYAMNSAIQKFETVSFLRGGRIAGFLDRQRTPFYLTKKLTEVGRIGAQGRSVRVAQWVIDLQAEVDASSLLRDSEDEEAAILQARHAMRVLEGSGQGGAVVDPPSGGTATAESTEAALDVLYAESSTSVRVESSEADVAVQSRESSMRSVEPTLERVHQRIQSYGIELSQFDSYADKRWGRGWRLNVGGRRRAFEELGRYRNDPQGYFDKIDCALRGRG